MAKAHRRSKGNFRGTNRVLTALPTSPVGIMERYLVAIGASNLSSRAGTYRSDADLLGCMAFAGRAAAKRNAGGWSHAGADALARAVGGDVRAVGEAVDSYATRLIEEAEFHDYEVTEASARSIVKACIAWLIVGTCRKCEGRKTEMAPHSSIVTNIACRACHGTGKISFVEHFPPEVYDAARWVAARMISDLVICEEEMARLTSLEAA